MNLAKHNEILIECDSMRDKVVKSVIRTRTYIRIEFSDGTNLMVSHNPWYQRFLSWLRTW